MTSFDTPMDWINGRRVPARVVTDNEELLGVHQGSVLLRPGSTLSLVGTLQGSLHLDSGSEAVIRGACQGSLHVSTEARVHIFGRQEGSVHLEEGGSVAVQPGGKLAGSLHNEGLILNQGVRGGKVTGEGTLTDLPGSCVKDPIIKNGTWIYHW